MAAEDLPPPEGEPPRADEGDDNDEADLFGTGDDDAGGGGRREVGDDGATSPAAVSDATDLGAAIASVAGPSALQTLASNPPPATLPPGWFLRESRSAPGCHYYFNHDTGDCRWEHPAERSARGVGTPISPGTGGVENLQATAAAAASAVKSILKRSNSAPSSDSVAEGGGAAPPSAPAAPAGESSSPAAAPTPRKRAKTSASGERGERREKPSSSSGGKERGKERRHSGSTSSSRHHHHRSERESGRGGGGSDDPREVRVLHILKKHRGSRRPASWRNPKITDAKEKAVADLRELIGILNENPGPELRAAFEELARTESDCSSAKRGGDLGFFGRKKMQPAFEKASFGLKVGQLSDVVDTSSGVHVIMRLA
ncbi:hypothetical protein ACHAWF_005617 [Thalassiosira exigua]